MTQLSEARMGSGSRGQKGDHTGAKIDIGGSETHQHDSNG